MSYRNDRLNKSMKSLEDSAQGIDLAKWRVLSDCGIGVERMVEAIDWEEKKVGRESRSTMEGSDSNAGESDRDDRLFEAEMRLAKAGKSYLIRVLLLIVENGADREISLKSVPRRTYFRHRDELLSFFSWHSAAHGDIEGHVIPRPIPVTSKDRCNRA